MKSPDDTAVLPWTSMGECQRVSLANLTQADIPTSPGVYALYRHNIRIYVGKATSLRGRIWQNHSGRGAVMTGSALRRNIAEHLGIATSADIKARRYQPTADEISAVRLWLDECEIAWIECGTAQGAEQLERDFKSEYMPMLTKR